jgi:hypothetical protein
VANAPVLPDRPPAQAPGRLTRNLLVDYRDRLAEVVARRVADAAPVEDPERFSPGWALPPPDRRLRRFFGAADGRWSPLGEYRSHRLVLLDLMGNPGTNTSKTAASLLMVARAVAYVRRGGRPVAILTPTSANKGVALRDAVERAITAGLVDPDQLRSILLVPASSRPKLRNSLLATDPELRRLNPVLLLQRGPAVAVKALAKEFVRDHGAAFTAASGAYLWQSHDLGNYLVADAARAFLEQEAAPTAGAPPRLHVQAVSSAFGLLGYNAGRDVLEADGLAGPGDRPGFLLVQHLGTPDMVLALRHGSFARDRLPTYARGAGGRYEQCRDPRFPTVTDDPQEVLDQTFYTHEPPTAAAMTGLIERFGGDGIVVSGHECRTRYPRLRSLLAGTTRPLPADTGRIREWSLIMAVTGAMNAIDRGLVDQPEVVVHGTGFYTTADYRPLDDAAMIPVGGPADMAAVLLGGRA